MVNIRLKSAMLEAGLSGLQLSQNIGVGPTRLSYIVNGWVDATEEEKASIHRELKKKGLFDKSQTRTNKPATKREVSHE